MNQRVQAWAKGGVPEILVRMDVQKPPFQCIKSTTGEFCVFYIHNSVFKISHWKFEIAGNQKNYYEIAGIPAIAGRFASLLERTCNLNKL